MRTARALLEALGHTTEVNTTWGTCVPPTPDETPHSKYCLCETCLKREKKQ